MIGPSYDPVGTPAIGRWAASRQMGYDKRPEQSWFRGWEPYDTMVSPACYLNACSWKARPATAVIAEPWTEEGDTEPMDRTLLGLVSHPGLRHRASMRSGEHFITRVAFVQSRPPPQVQLGDALWDQHVVTFAADAREAAMAFHPELRRMLATWGLRGHLELRPGGLVLHDARLKPTAADYERLARALPDIVNTALRYPV